MKYIAFSLILVVASVMLGGCQSTGVIPMDQDSYYIGKKDGSPGLGLSLGNKAEVYKEANAFCSEKGLEVKVLREIVTPALPQLELVPLNYISNAYHLEGQRNHLRKALIQL